MAGPRPVQTHTPPQEVLARAATEYAATRGYACLALKRNEDGLPKVPIANSYARRVPAENLGQPWATADGLGIVLGKPSGNLAVIDVDDAGLSDFLLRNLRTVSTPPLMARTARSRLHI